MRGAWVWIGVLCACGRIGFDPAGAVDPTGDAQGVADGGGGGDGGIDGAADGPGVPTPLLPGGETCAAAVDLAINTSGTASLAGATDDFDPLLPGCQDGPEVVYRITVPTTQDRRIRFSPSGFSASLLIVRGCPPAGGACQSVFMNQAYDDTSQLQAGTTFLIIERASGAGTSYDLLLE